MGNEEELKDVIRSMIEAQNRAEARQAAAQERADARTSEMLGNVAL